MSNEVENLNVEETVVVYDEKYTVELVDELTSMSELLSGTINIPARMRYSDYETYFKDIVHKDNLTADDKVWVEHYVEVAGGYDRGIILVDEDNNQVAIAPPIMDSSIISLNHTVDVDIGEGSTEKISMSLGGLAWEECLIKGGGHDTYKIRALPSKEEILDGMIKPSEYEKILTEANGKKDTPGNNASSDAIELIYD